LGGPTPELEVPIGLPTPPIYRTPTTGKFIDVPKLNQRRRLAILALSGKITAEEFADLKERSQTEYRPYEERPPAPRSDWAQPLVEEVKSIDETVMAYAIPGWLDMTPEQREESYCPRPRILKTLRELALSGRITPEEHKQVLDNLIEHLSR
jgi:hypothetical protein